MAKEPREAMKTLRYLVVWFYRRFEYAWAGFVVNMTWKNGQLTSAQVQSSLGKSGQVRYREHITVRTDIQKVLLQAVAPQVVRWPMVAGQCYTLYL